MGHTDRRRADRVRRAPTVRYRGSFERPMSGIPDAAPAAVYCRILGGVCASDPESERTASGASRLTRIRIGGSSYPDGPAQGL